jgi:hypothetical protein
LKQARLAMIGLLGMIVQSSINTENGVGIAQQTMQWLTGPSL